MRDVDTSLFFINVLSYLLNYPSRVVLYVLAHCQALLFEHSVQRVSMTVLIPTVNVNMKT